jgi:hypothetical protein
MIDIAKAAEDHARAVLRMRSDAEQELAKALAANERKHIRSWQSQLRKINKLIADYGLERYVSRS